MSSGRVSLQAYKAGLRCSWEGHLLSKTRVHVPWFVVGLIKRFVLSLFIAVRPRRPRFAGPLGVRPKYYARVWVPINAARSGYTSAASAPSVFSLYVSNWSRLPRRGRFWRAIVLEVGARQVFSTAHSGALGSLTWFSARQELVLAKAKAVRFLIFRFSRWFRQLRAQHKLAALLGAPVRVVLLSISRILAYQVTLWSAFQFLQSRAGRFYGRRFAFLVLSLGAALFWRDMGLVVRVFAMGIKRTHYHYSAIKHLGRVATNFLCWNLGLRLLVMQFMGRFNRRDRTGRFDLVSGFGILGRSSQSILTYSAFGYVRTHRGVFGVRAWAR